MVFRKKRKDPFKEIQACLQKRDYKGALDWFNTLLQKDPKNTQIRLRFADTLVLAGSKKEAVKQLRLVADELADKGFMSPRDCDQQEDPPDRSAANRRAREARGNERGALDDGVTPHSGGSIDATRCADPACH